MKREVITRIKLTADDGMKLTDGKDIYVEIFLAVGASEDTWHEITEAEAQAIMSEAEKEEIV